MDASCQDKPDISAFKLIAAFQLDYALKLFELEVLAVLKINGKNCFGWRMGLTSKRK